MRKGATWSARVAVLTGRRARRLWRAEGGVRSGTAADIDPDQLSIITTLHAVRRLITSAANAVGAHAPVTF
jgi:hypothetical protein